MCLENVPTIGLPPVPVPLLRMENPKRRLLMEHLTPDVEFVDAAPGEQRSTSWKGAFTTIEVPQRPHLHLHPYRHLSRKLLLLLPLLLEDWQHPTHTMEEIFIFTVDSSLGSSQK
jgi:hypothetical protein